MIIKRSLLSLVVSLVLSVKAAEAQAQTRDHAIEEAAMGFPRMEASQQAARGSSNSTLVDFSGMPDCSKDQCNSTQVQCTQVDGSYTTACYCNLTTPLSCAWPSPSWYEWMVVEDWFSEQCPNVPPVNFTGVPACAKSCIVDQSFSYGCISESRNCFCLLESFFSCADSCDGADRAMVEVWYATVCALPLAAAAEIISGSNSTNATMFVTLHPPHRAIHWYEWLAIGVLILSVVLFILGTILILIFEYKCERAIEAQANGGKANGGGADGGKANVDKSAYHRLSSYSSNA